MPILEIKIVHHRGKTGKDRLYKKEIALSKCDQCEKIWEAKRFKKDSSLTFCSRKCVDIASKKGGKIDQAKCETSLARYGVENPLQSKEVWERRTQTIIERYSVKHIQHSDEWKAKRKQAIHQKYGKEYVETDEFKKKRQETLIEKYGVKSPMEHEEFVRKRRKTNIERYGGHPLKDPDIRNKMLNTNLKRHGYKTSFESKETQEKAYKARNGMSREEYLKLLPEYIAYRNEVRRITSQQPLHTLQNYKKRGRDTYHLDHIYSISQGFKDGVLPEVIGNICNLRMLSASENRSKSQQCDILLEELLEKYYESRK